MTAKIEHLRAHAGLVVVACLAVLCGVSYTVTYGQPALQEAQNLSDEARLRESQRQPAEAELLYKRALAIREQILGPEHLEVARTLTDLGHLYHGLGRYAEAEPLYSRALAIAEKKYAYWATPVIRQLMAEAYIAQGNYADAELVYKRAVATEEKKYRSPQHLGVAEALQGLASVYDRQGKFSEADPLYERVLAIYDRLYGKRSERGELTRVLVTIASRHRAHGKYDEASALYSRALAIQEKALGPEHPLIATILEDYAAVLRKTDRDAEAAALEARARAIRAREDRR